MKLSPLQQNALKIAKTKLGRAEATGRNDGSLPSFLQRWAAKGAKWLDGQPWCVMFATWCVWEAARGLGIKSRIPERASSSRLYAWYRKNGLLLSFPVPGCVGLVRAGKAHGSDGPVSVGGKTHTHCFLVHDVQVRKGRQVVVGVDGNYRNAVSWSVRPASDCDYGQMC